MKPDIGIGALAAATGCKVQTIRFYEQIGLLPPPPRTEGNQRRYDEGSVKRLHFIRHARDMGFEINDIRELLALAANPAQECRKADEIALRHLESIRAKIRRLKKLEKELSHLAACPKHRRAAECRVLEVLSDHGKGLFCQT